MINISRGKPAQRTAAAGQGGIAIDKFWYIPEGGVQPEEFRPPPKRRLRVKVNIPYQDDLPHPNILTIPCLDLPVPEALGGLFKQWCHRQAIIISAPTGAQKTTYIL